MSFRRAVFVVLPSLLLTASAVLSAPEGAAAGHGEGKAEKGAQDARNAIKSVKYDDGLKAELFAAEPLLANPVAFYPDEQGRWYIAETFRQEKGVEDNRAHGAWLKEDIAARTVDDRLAMMRKHYPDPKKFDEKFAKEEDRVSLVEDTNGDGLADRTTVFAGGFRNPLDGTGAGIIARNGEVWWTCIPNLWRFRDSNKDGKAEEKEQLLSGFGVRFAFRGHDMHGLRFGPDGKLYFSIGDRGIHVKSKEGKTFSEPDTGVIMRCNPDGTGFEIYATGVRNPQELAFDAYGNLFSGDNNSDGGDKARLIQIVEGGDSGWRMAYQYLNDRGPWNREKLWDAKEARKARYLIPPIANISNGPSGFTYNPGAGLAGKRRGKFYLSDFRGGASASVVHEIDLDRQGAFFKMKEARDFIKGLLTTDVEFGPDGGLYVLDWVESWGGVGKGRIYRFTEKGADEGLQAETKKFISEGMAGRASEELGRLLAHPDQRVRMAAQFELAGRGPASVEILAKVARDNGDVFGRIHAIWGIGQLAGRNAQVLGAIIPLLGDGNADIRAQTARVLGDARAPGTSEKLIELLRDSNETVRYYAAMALGKKNHKGAFDAICRMLAENQDADPIVRHGGVMALTAFAAPEQLAAKASDPSPAVRVGALLALRRQKSGEAAKFLADTDRAIVLEAARAIHDAPIEKAFPALAALVAKKDLKDRHVLSRAVNANYRLGRGENAKALAALSMEKSAPEVVRREALDALAEWAKPAAQDRLLNIWRPLPDRGPEEAIAAVTPIIGPLLQETPGGVQEAAAQLVIQLKLAVAGEPLMKVASNGNASPGARIAALRALAALKDGRLPQAARAAIADKNEKVRAEGLRALAEADPAEAVKAIGEIVNSGSASERQAAVIALREINRPESKQMLASLIDRIMDKSAPAEVQLDILEAARKVGGEELKKKLKEYEEKLPTDDPLAPYRVSLSGGDDDRGRKIFREKVEVQCLRCHKCEIGDSLVGPDLTRIGSQKDRQYLLESIVFPSRHIAQGFETVVLTLKDKNMVAGRLLKEESGRLEIETMDEQGKPKTMAVAGDQIAERISAPSPMPENIRDFLSKSELRDLVEYLALRK